MPCHALVTHPSKKFSHSFHLVVSFLYFVFVICSAPVPLALKMSEFYKSSSTKLTPHQSTPAAFNLTQKFPDVSAILNSCDEMIKIASHTREKAKILQKQMGDLTRAIPMRAATARRPATVGSLKSPKPPTPQSTTPAVDAEQRHQLQVTSAPKQILSSCSSTSVSSNEQQKVVKLKGITTINPVMTASVVPSKRIQAGKASPRKADTKLVQRTINQRRVNNVLPPLTKRPAPKTPSGGERSKGRALPNLLPPFKKISSTNSSGSQMRVTSAKVPGSGSVGGAIASPRSARTGRD